MRGLEDELQLGSIFSRQLAIFQGKLFQVHMQVQYSLPTSYSATGLTSPGVVKTLLSTSHLLGTLTEDILVELSILRPIPGLLFLTKKVVMKGKHKASSSWP